MRKLISVAVAVAFALTLATMVMAAPKKAVKKAAAPVKAEVVKVEKGKLVVKVDGKEKTLKVSKKVAKDAAALKAGDMVELVVVKGWVKSIKAAEAAAAPAPAPAPAAAPAPAPAAPAPTK